VQEVTRKAVVKVKEAPGVSSVFIEAAFRHGLPPGDPTAKQIYTLVEILEGVPDEEIAKQPKKVSWGE
jgi:hypothetical protein